MDFSNFPYVDNYNNYRDEFQSEPLDLSQNSPFQDNSQESLPFSKEVIDIVGTLNHVLQAEASGEIFDVERHLFNLQLNSQNSQQSMSQDVDGNNNSSNNAMYYDNDNTVAHDQHEPFPSPPPSLETNYQLNVNIDIEMQVDQRIVKQQQEQSIEMLEEVIDGSFSDDDNDDFLFLASQVSDIVLSMEDTIEGQEQHSEFLQENRGDDEVNSQVIDAYYSEPLFDSPPCSTTTTTTIQQINSEIENLHFTQNTNAMSINLSEDDQNNGENCYDNNNSISSSSMVVSCSPYENGGSNNGANSNDKMSDDEDDGRLTPVLHVRHDIRNSIPTIANDTFSNEEDEENNRQNEEEEVKENLAEVVKYFNKPKNRPNKPTELENGAEQKEQYIKKLYHILQLFFNGYLKASSSNVLPSAEIISWSNQLTCCICKLIQPPERLHLCTEEEKVAILSSIQALSELLDYFSGDCGQKKNKKKGNKGGKYDSKNIDRIVPEISNNVQFLIQCLTKLFMDPGGRKTIRTKIQCKFALEMVENLSNIPAMIILFEEIIECIREKLKAVKEQAEDMLMDGKSLLKHSTIKTLQNYFSVLEKLVVNANNGQPWLLKENVNQVKCLEGFIYNNLPFLNLGLNATSLRYWTTEACKRQVKDDNKLLFVLSLYKFNYSRKKAVIKLNPLKGLHNSNNVGQQVDRNVQKINSNHQEQSNSSRNVNAQDTNINNDLNVGNNSKQVENLSETFTQMSFDLNANLGNENPINNNNSKPVKKPSKKGRKTKRKTNRNVPKASGIPLVPSSSKSSSSKSKPKPKPRSHETHPPVLFDRRVTRQLSQQLELTLDPGLKL